MTAIPYVGMTDQEHAAEIKDAAMRLNALITRACNDWLRIEADIMLSNRIDRQPHPVVDVNVVRVINP